MRLGSAGAKNHFAAQSVRGLERDTMGTDIMFTAERRVDDQWEFVKSEYREQRYALFGWLADVRNYAAIPLLEPLKGVPTDACSQTFDYHCDEDQFGQTWYLVDKLLAFDFDQPVENRRVGGYLPNGIFDGSITAEPGGGVMTTYRNTVGIHFLKELERLKSIGATRIIISFDR